MTPDSPNRSALRSLLPANAQEHLPEDTTHRFTKFMREALDGYNRDPKDYLKVFDVAGERAGLFGPVRVNDITFSSLCEHHIAPFHGTADVAYQPAAGHVLGISKFARVIDALALRFQVQERLTAQVAEAIYTSKLGPVWVAVRMRATHTCMVCRGVRRPGATTETLAFGGPVPSEFRF